MGTRCIVPTVVCGRNGRDKVICLVEVTCHRYTHGDMRLHRLLFCVPAPGTVKPICLAHVYLPSPVRPLLVLEGICSGSMPRARVFAVTCTAFARSSKQKVRG